MTLKYYKSTDKLVDLGIGCTDSETPVHIDFSQIFQLSLTTWRQFHQLSMSSFCALRSQKHEKTLMTWLSFWHIWDLHTQKLHVKHWWNWHQKSTSTFYACNFCTKFWCQKLQSWLLGLKFRHLNSWCSCSNDSDSFAFQIDIIRPFGTMHDSAFKRLLG